MLLSCLKKYVLVSGSFQRILRKYMKQFSPQRMLFSATNSNSHRSASCWQLSCLSGKSEGTERKMVVCWLSKLCHRRELHPPFEFLISEFRPNYLVFPLVHPPLVATVQPPRGRGFGRARLRGELQRHDPWAETALLAKLGQGSDPHLVSFDDIGLTLSYANPTSV